MSETTETIVYQFKVNVIAIWPRIWRRIVVPQWFTFYQLHVAIQDAMGWKHRHPYMFYEFSRTPQLCISLPPPPPPIMPLPLSKIDIRIDSHFKEVGDRAIYLYDFACFWEHRIELEWFGHPSGISCPSAFNSFLACIGGERACPPEDIGGLGQYEAHVAILSNPLHPYHFIYKAWLAAVESSDKPEEFNYNSVVFTNAEERYLSSYVY